MAATVLFYGADSHAALRLLAGHVEKRGRKRVLYVPQESVPRGIRISLPAGPEEMGGSLSLVGGAPLNLDDVVGVCLDGLYVGPEQLAGLDEKDLAYAQVEIWSTLIALFGRLARTARVANVLRPRDVAESRIALMSFLAAQGLPVPRMLVTSDVQAARQFYEELEGRVSSRLVAHAYSPFAPVVAADLDRLDAIRLAPVHFEETPGSPASIVTVVGREVFVQPLGGDETGRRGRRRATPQVPETLRQRCVQCCSSLGLEMAEVVLARSSSGWLVTNLLLHLSAESLADGRILDAAALLLEGETS